MDLTCIFCTHAMHSPDRFDTGSSYAPDGNSYCFNLWLCIHCGAICRNSLWDKPGMTWLAPLHLEGEDMQVEVE